MKTLFKHLRKYFFRGILAIIPIALTIFILRLLYLGIDNQLIEYIDNAFGVNVPGIGVILVLLALYLLGLITSNVIGKKILHYIEQITLKIPVIKTTYQVGSQLSKMFSLPEKEVLKRAVLISYLMPGMWTIGFVTGSIIDRENNDEKLLKVYVPTPPIPTSGTLVLVREAQTRDPGWTIEQAMRAVISGGIIAPDEIK